MVLKLFTKLVTFPVGVFIIKIGISSLKRLSGDTFSAYKKNESWGEGSLIFYVAFYEQIKQTLWSI